MVPSGWTPSAVVVGHLYTKEQTMTEQQHNQLLLQSYIKQNYYKLAKNFKPPLNVGYDYSHDDPSNFMDLTHEEQNTLLSWILDSLVPARSVNYRHNSYETKHDFSDSSLGFYVTNGQFKGAMFVAGFKTDKLEQQNWCFNVSEKSYKNIVKTNANTSNLGILKYRLKPETIEINNKENK